MIKTVTAKADGSAREQYLEGITVGEFRGRLRWRLTHPVQDIVGQSHDPAAVLACSITHFGSLAKSHV